MSNPQPPIWTDDEFVAFALGVLAGVVLMLILMVATR